MPVHQIDPSSYPDSELSQHLLTVRGIQWAHGVHGDPYALILRDQDPDLHRLYGELRAGPSLRQSQLGAWATVSHSVARAILGDRRLGLSHPDTGPDDRTLYALGSRVPPQHVLTLDGAFLGLSHADHDRLHEFARPALGVAAVDRHRDAVAGETAAIAGRLGGEFDLMTGFARPAAVAATAALFGLTAEEHARLGLLCPDAATALDALLCPPTLATTRALVTSIEGIQELFSGLIERRSGSAGDDALSELLRGAEGPPYEDVLAAAVLTAVVGVEVSANLVCDAVLALLDHPEQWTSLCESPELAVGAVEETLRYHSPVRLESRIALEDLELAGQVIRKSEQVVVLVEAANRDPEAFADPDDFLITRPDVAGHLTLTGGLHTTFVAPQARLQAVVALRTLAARFPRLRRTGPVIRRRRSPVVRGVARCPVAVGQS
ncbi:cytochrome P450 family protein [Amycolatopsis alba]|nr:P450-derived glycosyltransferase activator [Amycolatopsis alba]